MRPATVVPFPADRRLHLRRAKAQLRDDVRLSVERSLRELPELGQHDPKGALLAGELIHRWNHPPPDGGVEHSPSSHKAADWRRPKKAALTEQLSLFRDDVSAMETRIAFALALGEDPVKWFQRQSCA